MQNLKVHSLFISISSTLPNFKKEDKQFKLGYFVPSPTPPLQTSKKINLYMVKHKKITRRSPSLPKVTILVCAELRGRPSTAGRTPPQGSDNLHRIPKI